MIPVSGWVRCLRGIAGVTVCLVTLAVTARAQQKEAAPDEFHVGDRIALTVEGPTAVSDTVVVREGLVIRLPGLGDIPLAGVRRTDAQKYLTQQIARFVKDPIVHATPLVRVAVLGEVGKPGFYSLPSDVLLSDVVMRAGGPTGASDLNKTVVKRGTKEVVSTAAMQKAIDSGMTLDELQIAPGDQIVVGQKSQRGLQTYLQIFGIVATVAGLAITLGSTRR